MSTSSILETEAAGDRSFPERQAALRAAVSLALEVAEVCSRAARAARPVLEHGRVAARPDGEAGVELLRAAQQGLPRLAQANVAVLRDTSLISAVQSRLDDLWGGQSVPPTVGVSIVEELCAS